MIYVDGFFVMSIAASMTSERLQFFILREEDAQALFATFNNQKTCDVVAILSWPAKIEHAIELCQKSVHGYAQQTDFMFLVKYDENPAGFIAVHVDPNNKQQGEVGYWLAPSHQGQGFAQEMLMVLIDFATHDIGLSELTATTDAQNTDSQKLLRKQGFVETGSKDVQTAKGKLRSSCLFHKKISVS